MSAVQACWHGCIAVDGAHPSLVSILAQPWLEAVVLVCRVSCWLILSVAIVDLHQHHVAASSEVDVPAAVVN